MLASHEIGVVNLQRGGDDAAADIDLSALPKHDAGWIDQKHLAVGLDPAFDLGWMRAGDAVEDSGLAIWLLDVDLGLAPDIEALPVDHGAGTGLVDGHLRPGLLDLGAARSHRSARG